MAPAFRRGGENATPLDPFSELCRKVALLISDDWLALSRCRPLLAVLKTLAHSLVVVTRSSGRLGEIEALGARVVDFDFLAFASNPVRHAAAAWTLARRLEERHAGVRSRQSCPVEPAGRIRARPPSGPFRPGDGDQPSGAAMTRPR